MRHKSRRAPVCYGDSVGKRVQVQGVQFAFIHHLLPVKEAQIAILAKLFGRDLENIEIKYAQEFVTN